MYIEIYKCTLKIFIYNEIYKCTLKIFIYNEIYKCTLKYLYTMKYINLHRNI